MLRKAPWPAALLAAVMLILSAVAPGAFATAPAAIPPPDPVRTLLIPRGTHPTPQELREVAKRLLADPMGRALALAWIRFRALPYPPQDIAVGFFHFGWMWDDPGLPEWVRDDWRHFAGAMMSEADETSRPARNPLTVTRTSADSELYERLGLEAPSPYDFDAPSEDMLLQVAAGSGWDGHSEPTMLKFVERAVEEALRKGARTEAQRAQVKAAVATIMTKSKAGIADLRTSCHECAPSTKDFRRALAIGFFDKAGTADSKLTNSILNGSLVQHVEKEIHEWVTGETETAATNVGLSPQCSPVSGGGMAVLPLAGNHCGDSDGLVRGLTSGTPGGVDFTSLQLRYMSDNPGSRVKYAFSGTAATGSSQDVHTGLAAVRDSTADLRTWLVLDPNKFWVNLNPSEPERIMDAQLGQTDAGRALLEADYAMKRSLGKMLDPNTAFGARYWRKLAGGCFSSRQWIVPGEVKVREDGSSLYILKAALDVKARAEYVAAGAQSCHADAAEIARNEKLTQSMLLPKIVRAVNSDPEYARLRRAYLARIVAQWIRQRHENGHSTSFGNLIDIGDLGPAKLTNGWQPRQVYDRFVRSIRNGDFTYTRTSGGVRYTMTVGGVDFSQIHPTKITATQMQQQYAGLGQAVRSATTHPAKATDGSIWLGQTAGAGGISTWTRVTDYIGGRTGLLVIILAAFGIIVFGLRGGPLRRRPPTSPGG